MQSAPFTVGDALAKKGSTYLDNPTGGRYIKLIINTAVKRAAYSLAIAEVAEFNRETTASDQYIELVKEYYKSADTS